MQYVWFPTFVFESHGLYFDVEWTKTSRTCFWIKKAILPIRHIHNPTKFFFLCRPKMYYHCYTLVYCVVLLYQYTRWMYCYYEDKKFKLYNCFTAIFIREKLGKYGENQFKRFLYYCHYWTKNVYGKYRKVRYKWPFLSCFLSYVLY